MPAEVLALPALRPAPCPCSSALGARFVLWAFPTSLLAVRPQSPVGETALYRGRDRPPRGRVGSGLLRAPLGRCLRRSGFAFLRFLFLFWFTQHRAGLSCVAFAHSVPCRLLHASALFAVLGFTLSPPCLRHNVTFIYVAIWFRAPVPLVAQQIFEVQAMNLPPLRRLICCCRKRLVRTTTISKWRRLVALVHHLRALQLVFWAAGVRLQRLQKNLAQRLRSLD